MPWWNDNNKVTWGQKIIDTGAPIQIPNGKVAHGCILSIIGEPINEHGPIKGVKLFMPTPLPSSINRAGSIGSGAPIQILIGKATRERLMVTS